MKITPLDIQQREFKGRFRGYDREEVQAFLRSVSQTVEEMFKENIALKEHADKLSQDLAAEFFALRVEDRSHPMLSTDEVAALPEKSVIGHFARRMTALISEATDPEEKSIREAALQLGLALLQGRKVLT